MDTNERTACSTYITSNLQDPLKVFFAILYDLALGLFHALSANLQEHLLEINNWTRKWKLKINESKSTHITFALRRGQCPPVNKNQTDVPQVETVKYLGIHFDRRLTWKDHVLTKRKQLDLKSREIKWLIGRHSPLSLENKILIYKTVLKPVWTYGIELWGCA